MQENEVTGDDLYSLLELYPNERVLIFDKNNPSLFVENGKILKEIDGSPIKRISFYGHSDTQGRIYYADKLTNSGERVKTKFSPKRFARHLSSHLKDAYDIDESIREIQSIDFIGCGLGLVDEKGNSFSKTVAKELLSLKKIGFNEIQIYAHTNKSFPNPDQIKNLIVHVVPGQLLVSGYESTEAMTQRDISLDLVGKLNKQKKEITKNIYQNESRIVRKSRTLGKKKKALDEKLKLDEYQKNYLIDSMKDFKVSILSNKEKLLEIEQTIDAYKVILYPDAKSELEYAHKIMGELKTEANKLKKKDKQDYIEYKNEIKALSAFLTSKENRLHEISNEILDLKSQSEEIKKAIRIETTYYTECELIVENANAMLEEQYAPLAEIEKEIEKLKQENVEY